MNYLLNTINYSLIFILIIYVFKPTKTLKHFLYAISVFLFYMIINIFLVNIPLYIFNYNILPILLKTSFIMLFIPIIKNKYHLTIYGMLIIPTDLITKILLSDLLNLPFKELNQVGYFYFSSYKLIITLLIESILMFIIKTIKDYQNNKEIIFTSIAYGIQFILEFVGLIIINFSLVKVVFVDQINYKTLVLINVLFFVIFVGIIIINSILQRISLHKEKQINEYKELKLINEYDNIYIASQQELFKLRHDMANMINSINKYQDKETIDLVSDLTKKLNSTKTYNTNNKIINAILVNKINEAKNNNIHIDLSINIKNDINLPNSDIISLLTNLIDNSIEAVLHANDKTIKLELISIDSFDIVIKNNYNESIKIEKENKHLHGFGTKIIKEIVNRNNGKMLVQKANGYYLTHISIKYKQ